MYKRDALLQGATVESIYLIPLVFAPTSWGDLNNRVRRHGFHKRENFVKFAHRALPYVVLNDRFAARHAHAKRAAIWFRSSMDRTKVS